MKLMTEELKKQFPKLYSQDKKGFDAIVYARYFTPFSSWTWYATEFDPDERVFFGFVIGFEGEWGYFSLTEFEGLGMQIERDLHFTQRPLREVLKDEGNEQYIY